MFSNASHVFEVILGAMSGYAQHTNLIFSKVAIFFTVQKIKGVGCAQADISSKNYLKNVTNIWKHTVKDLTISCICGYFVFAHLIAFSVRCGSIQFSANNYDDYGSLKAVN